MGISLKDLPVKKYEKSCRFENIQLLRYKFSCEPTRKIMFTLASQIRCFARMTSSNDRSLQIDTWLGANMLYPILPVVT